MQSLRIGLLLGFIYACSFCNALPLGEAQAEPETRIIIPPELPPSYFEMLKEKSVATDNDSTPIHFLRLPQNTSVPMQPSVVALEGSKQIPIYITIPIYIYPSYHAQQGPDGAVIASTPLRSLIDPEDDKISVTPEVVETALKEILVDTFSSDSREAAGAQKKSVERKKLRKIYKL